MMPSRVCRAANIFYVVMVDQLLPGKYVFGDADLTPPGGNQAVLSLMNLVSTLCSFSWGTQLSARV